MTPLERAARALQSRWANGSICYDDIDFWKEMAIHALLSIREPSAEMVDAGSDPDYRERAWPGGEQGETVPADIVGAWKAMIDVALEQPETPAD